MALNAQTTIEYPLGLKEVRGVRVVDDETIDSYKAAELLEVTPDWVRKLIRKGKLPGTKFGRDYAIKRSDVLEFKKQAAGRPPKNQQG